MTLALMPSTGTGPCFPSDIVGDLRTVEDSVQDKSGLYTRQHFRQLLYRLTRDSHSWRS